MMRKQLICYLLMTLLVVPMIWSQERAIRPANQQSNADVRQALVIGNSAYTSAGMLRNPVNDARAISNTLSQLGFGVTMITNADQRKMEQSIRDFGRELRDQKGVGLFYYAGHGMQFDGENYLLPTDIDPSTEEDVRYDAVPVGKLLAQMRAADNKMNVVILDACRNNPFSRSFRTFNPGLAQVNAAAGTFISFATAPGQIAADGEGSNGLFTSKLLEHLRTPGLKIEEVFKRTTADVYRASNKRQAPWVQYSVIGDFYFSPGEAVESSAVVKSNQQAPQKQLKQEPASVLSGEAAIKKLLETKECARCDLRGANLKSANLEYADLRAAYLYGADLRGASLEGADLTDANLRGAKIDLTDFLNVMSAKFCNTTMLYGEIENRDCEQLTQEGKSNLTTETLLSGEAAKRKLLSIKECVGCDLSGMALVGRDFRGVNLSEANLTAVNFQEADLRSANLRNANLKGSDLRKANLSSTSFVEANLLRAILDGAILKEADFERANLFEANLGGVNLRHTNLFEANLRKVILHLADLEGANLWYADLRGADLRGVQNWRAASLGYTKFCNTKMPDGSINNSDC
jgi:uncharacterized protein YjbI with pentapeptide repeats